MQQNKRKIKFSLGGSKIKGNCRAGTLRFESAEHLNEN